MKRSIQALTLAALLAGAQSVWSDGSVFPQSIDDSPGFTLRATHSERPARAAKPRPVTGFPTTVDEYETRAYGARRAARDTSVGNVLAAEVAGGADSRQGTAR